MIDIINLVALLRQILTLSADFTQAPAGFQPKSENVSILTILYEFKMFACTLLLILIAN